MTDILTRRYWKRGFRVVWKVKWWYLPLFAVFFGLQNEVANGGYFIIRSGDQIVYFYFGVGSAFWGILLGVFLGVFWNKVRAASLTVGHAEAWALQQPKVKPWALPVGDIPVPPMTGESGDTARVEAGETVPAGKIGE